jgi:hypothetical protein
LVIAVHRCENTSRRNIASVNGTEVVVAAGNQGKLAAVDFVTRVISTIIVIVADYTSENTTSRGVAGVVGARIAIITAD